MITPNSDNSSIAILIIPGSGYCDRDGNIGTLKLNIYKTLADALTTNGFTTLRYDKRGVGSSLGNYFQAGLSNSINDAVSALSFLKNNEYIKPKKIILLGHSEGAFIAPAVYTREHCDGLILLCGTSFAWERNYAASR